MWPIPSKCHQAWVTFPGCPYSMCTVAPSGEYYGVCMTTLRGQMEACTWIPAYLPSTSVVIICILFTVINPQPVLSCRSPSESLSLKVVLGTPLQSFCIQRLTGSLTHSLSILALPYARGWVYRGTRNRCVLEGPWVQSGL